MELRHTKWVGLVLHMGEMTKEDKHMVRKHEGQGPLMRSTHRCDNNKINVKVTM